MITRGNLENRIVVTLGDEPDTHESATKLGHAFFQEKDVQVIRFSAKENFFNSMPDTHLEEIVFLGHGNRKQYDKFKPAAFAKQFRKQFEASRSADHKLKTQVKHVYLVGCSLGLIDKDGNSYAQSIATRLYKEGFTQVEVHALSAMQVTKQDYLNVKVNTREELCGLTVNIQEYNGGAAGKPMHRNGYLSARLENDETKVSTPIVEGVAPRQELNRPTNIFGHKKVSLKIRMKEVEKKTIAAKQLSRAEAIAFFYRRSQYLKTLVSSSRFKTKVRTPKFKKFDDYVARLNQVVNLPDDQWNKVLMDILVDVRNSGFFKKGGSTEKLALQLSNGNYAAVERLVEQQSEREAALVRVSEVAQASVSDPVVAPASASTLASALVPVPVVSPASPASALVRSSALALFSAVGGRVPGREGEGSFSVESALARNEKLPIKLQTEIGKLISDLNSEIKTINASCFSMFRCWEINTKIAKHNALLKFFDATKEGVGVSREEAYHIAYAASQDERVMRSKKTTRTQVLITEILRQTAEFGEEPNQDSSVNSSLLAKKKR